MNTVSLHWFSVTLAQTLLHAYKKKSLVITVVLGILPFCLVYQPRFSQSSITAIVACYRILHIVHTASDDSCGKDGLLPFHPLDQKSGILPCHYWEFNDTALQTQQCDQNTRRNNL